MSNNTNKFDAYTMVTDRIVALMESGIIPWARPWSSTSVGAWSRSTGNMYSLVNQMLLADPEKEYRNMDELLADVSGEWLTFKQALDLGGCVRKGESGRKVVFFKIHEKKTGELDDEGNEKVDRFPVLRCYTLRLKSCSILLRFATRTALCASLTCVRSSLCRKRICAPCCPLCAIWTLKRLSVLYIPCVAIAQKRNRPRTARVSLSAAPQTWT